jgi:hypothetical protein
MTEYRGSGSRAAIILNFGTNGGKLSASRLGHLTPGKGFQVPTAQEAGWAAKPVWSFWRKVESNPDSTPRSLVTTLTAVPRFVRVKPSCTRHKGICRKGGIAPLILKLGTWYRSVVSFTQRSLYPIEGATCNQEATVEGRDLKWF